jgi:hypothetical protein
MGSALVRPLLSAAGSTAGAGAVAAAVWLADRGLSATLLKRWHVEISLSTADTPASLTFDDRADTRFHIDIYSEEWGFFFCHAGRASWIRVTDIPFVHGRDEFALLVQTPPLDDIGGLLRRIEKHHDLSFKRQLALVRTNIPGSESVIRRWIESL